MLVNNLFSGFNITGVLKSTHLYIEIEYMMTHTHLKKLIIPVNQLYSEQKEDWCVPNRSLQALQYITGTHQLKPKGNYTKDHAKRKIVMLRDGLDVSLPTQ